MGDSTKVLRLFLGLHVILVHDFISDGYFSSVIISSCPHEDFTCSYVHVYTFPVYTQHVYTFPVYTHPLDCYKKQRTFQVAQSNSKFRSIECINNCASFHLLLVSKKKGYVIVYWLLFLGLSGLYTSLGFQTPIQKIIQLVETFVIPDPVSV